MEKYFIDTDIGSDCDDAGAFALLHTLSKAQKAQIIGCNHCGSEPSGAVTIKAINHWYGRDDIPVGQFQSYPFLEEEICKRFSSVIAAQYLAEHPAPVFEDSVKTLRRALAENQNVTLITIGMLNNIAQLLQSQPDEISDKTGLELCQDSVKEMYSMGGNFADPNFCEYNIATDIESARYVAEHFPKPINYIGFELGDPVITGKHLDEASDSCPMKLAYNTFSGRRQSWDPLTVYCAVFPDNPFLKKREHLTISFDEKGRTQVQPGGKDCFFEFHAAPESLQEELERYMLP